MRVSAPDDAQGDRVWSCLLFDCGCHARSRQNLIPDDESCGERMHRVTMRGTPY